MLSLLLPTRNLLVSQWVGGMEELVSLMLREHQAQETSEALCFSGVSKLSSTEPRLSALSRGVTARLFPQVLSASLINIAKRQHLVLPAEGIFFWELPFSNSPKESQ